MFIYLSVETSIINYIEFLNLYTFMLTGINNYTSGDTGD